MTIEYSDYEVMLNYQQACRALAQREYHRITDNDERNVVLGTTLVRLFNRPDLQPLHLYCERTELGTIRHAALRLDDGLRRDAAHQCVEACDGTQLLNERINVLKNAPLGAEAVPELYHLTATFREQTPPIWFRPRMLTVPVIDEERLLVANDYGTLYIACPQGSCFAREPENRGVMLDAARGQMFRLF